MPMLKALSFSGKSALSQETIIGAAYALGLLGLWMLAHPYRGLIHDGVLYAGQALLKLKPETFSHDLFFRFGSQDDYTIFSPIYAWLISRFGIGQASFFLVMAGQLLWMTGAVRLFSKISHNRDECAASLLGVVAGVSLYSGMSILFYGEGFVTPRLFSEALILHGLACVVNMQLLRAAAVAVVAILFHPLMAVPGLAASGLYLAFQDRRFWVLPVAGVLVFLGLSLMGISPFDRLFQAMDDSWYDAVRQRSAFTFLSAWRVFDWGWLFIHMAGAACAALVLFGPARRIFLAVVAMSGAALVVALVGGEWLKSVLILQLQFWRASWLLAVLGNAGLGLVLYRLWRQETNALALTAILFAGALWSNLLAGQLAMIGALALMTFQIRQGSPAYSRMTKLACIMIFVMSAVFLGIPRIYLLIPNIALYWTGVAAPGYVIFDFALLIILCAAFASSSWTRQGWRPLTLSSLIFIAGIASWDRRTNEEQIIERYVGQETPFQRHLSTSDEVYWRRGLKKAWFLLQRPSFVSVNQGAGIVFSEETTREYIQRAQIVAPLDRRDFLNYWVEPKERTEEWALNKPQFKDLVEVCRHPDGPDAVVMEFAYNAKWAEKWALPLAVDRAVDKTAAPPDAYYLYLCSDIAGKAGGAP